MKIKYQLFFLKLGEETEVQASPINQGQDEQLRIIMEQVKLDPTLAEDPEIKKIIDATNQAPAKAPAQATESVQTQAQENNQVTQNTEVDKPTDDDEKNDNPFISASKKEIKANLGKYTPENLIDFAKEQGIDTTKEEWLSSFLESYTSQRTNASKASELQKQIDSHVEFLNNLPTPLLLALKSYENGDDWRNSLSYDIDYNKNFDSLNSSQIISLISKEFPDEKLTEEDIKNDKDPVVKRMIAFAKKSFEDNKKSIQDLSAKEQQKIQDDLKSYESSVTSSLNNLQKEFPYFDDSKLPEIEKVLKKGIKNYFFDEKGVLVDDAAKKVAFMLFGENLIKTASKKSEKKGASDAAAVLINSTNQRGANSNSNTQNKQNDADAEVMKQHERFMQNNQMTY